MVYAEFIVEAAGVLRTSRVEVERLILSAPYRYKHYTIEKRNGGRRDIHHPTPALKAIQRWLVDGPLAQLPVHESVYSYRVGRNIAMHARAHLRSNFVTRFDFSDFFPSISIGVLRAFLYQEILRGIVSADRQTAEAIVRILSCYKKSTKRLGLSIGAPSSPFVSNALLYNFDCKMSLAANARGCTYTRYADDIYVSGRYKDDVQALEREFLAVVAENVSFLTVNDKKTQKLSRKRRISITGINVTPERKLSVGRSLKRSLTTRVFLALRGELDIAEIPRLRGMLAHLSSVEPSYISKLCKKFGSAQIEGLLR